MRNFAISVLIVIVTVALLLAFPNGKAEAQSGPSFVVSRYIEYIDANGTEHEPINQGIDGQFAGKQCDVDVTVNNNESVHTGNGVSVRAGNPWINLSNVSNSANQHSSASSTVTLGSNVSVIVILGADRTFSATVHIEFYCDEEEEVQPPPVEIPEPPPVVEVPEECIVTDLKGILHYEGNHVSGSNVTGDITNIATRSDCQNTAYIHIFGSYYEPESECWLECQEYIRTVTVTAEPGTIGRAISLIVADLGYCSYQVDYTRTPEVRVPPYYSGLDMIDYVFVVFPQNCGNPPPPTPPPPTGNPLPPAGKNCDAIGGLPVGNYMGIGIEHVENGHPTDLDELFSLGYVNEEGFALQFDARYKGVIAIIPVTDVEIDTAATAIEYFDTNTCTFVNAEPTVQAVSQVDRSYSDCRTKLLSGRENNGTVEEWDESDVILFTDFMGENPQASNTTDHWAENSRETSPSLSWNGCWFAAAHQPEDSDVPYLVWSPFGDMHFVLDDGEMIPISEADVGPLDEIVYVTPSGDIMLTDRYGNRYTDGPIDLGHQGYNVDYKADGTITFIDLNGRTQRIDRTGQIVDEERATDVMHNHPIEADTDFAESVFTAQAVVPFEDGRGNRSLMLEDTLDIAVSPIDGEAAVLQTAESQLNITENWFDDQVGENFTLGLFGVPVEDPQETWHDADWREGWHGN